MWILIPLVMCVGAGVLVIAVVRLGAARRMRREEWNDLHRRKELIATQLRHLEEVQKRRAPAE